MSSGIKRLVLVYYENNVIYLFKIIEIVLNITNMENS